MPDRFDLSGRTAIVTGGGGILGQGFCQVLADHGAKVAVFELDESLAKKTVDALGGNAIAVGCDVSDPKSVADAVARVVRDYGRIDILHNNAASKSSDLANFFAPFEEYRLETWREIMAVNIDGMFLMAQAVGKQMVAQGRGGSIIQTASIYGVVAPDQRIYEGSNYLGRGINTPAVYSASRPRSSG